MSLNNRPSSLSWLKVVAHGSSGIAAGSRAGSRLLSGARWVVPSILLLFHAGLACDGFHGPSATQRNDTTSVRSIVTASWDTLAQIGSSDPNDTTLLQPSGSGLLVWNNDLVVADGPNQTVRVISLDGTVRWSIHRPGQGPGEIGQLGDLAISPDGHLWVVDGRNVKILEFSTSGELLRELSLRHLPAIPSTLAVKEHQVFAFTQNAHFGLMSLDPDSFRVERAGPIPWPDSLHSDLNLQFAAATAPDNPSLDWVAGLRFGPGFLVSENGAVRAHTYIEHIPYALKSGPAVRAAGADSARYGARSAAIVDDEIHFLFGGRPRRQIHPGEPTLLVDVYGIDGRYRRSYQLPSNTRSIAVDGHALLVSTWIDETYPTILRLKPRHE